MGLNRSSHEEKDTEFRIQVMNRIANHFKQILIWLRNTGVTKLGQDNKLWSLIQQGWQHT